MTKKPARPLCGLILLLALCGCPVARLQEDLAESRGRGLVGGSIDTPSGSADGVVVILYQDTDRGPVLTSADRLSPVIRDYVFIVEASKPYFVFAFQDYDGDLVVDPGEPVGVSGRPEPIVVAPEELLPEQRITLDEATSPPAGLATDFSGLDLASLKALPIAVGEVTTLDDGRFTPRQAKAGMWTPITAIRESGAGVYFLESYNPERIPILFVHGIGGSPRDFRFLIERLDGDRYQPWVFHYPSGVRLHRAAQFLAQHTAALRDELGFERLFLTAHSMGGLVARSFLLRTGEKAVPAELFVSLSTPWGGHKAAAKGVRYSPVVIPSWLDIRPESDFLQSLHADLPAGTSHHLFFGFHTRRHPLMLYSHDTVVSVASQLAPWFQERARRTYGFNLDHTGILNDDEVARTFGRILDRTAERQEG